MYGNLLTIEHKVLHRKQRVLYILRIPISDYYKCKLRIVIIN